MIVKSQAMLSGEEPPTNARVRRALNLLRPLLESYVRQKLQDVPGTRLPQEMDLQGILKTMRDNPIHFFARESDKSLRNYVYLLLGARGANAHEKRLGERAARQIIDTVALVAEHVEAPREVVDAIDALNTQAPSLSAPPTASIGVRESSASTPQDLPLAVLTGTRVVGPAPARPEAPTASADLKWRARWAVPRRDVAGVILNAEELTASEVVMQRVLCPGCQKKVFKEWSAGWDAHAAYRCEGVTADTPEERKREFRKRFSHLFRGPARSQS